MRKEYNFGHQKRVKSLGAVAQIPFRLSKNVF